MKVLLLSQNFVVNKLVTLSAQKRGDELLVAQGVADAPEGVVDLLIVDEGIYNDILMEELDAKLTSHSTLYMGGQIREVPKGFEHSLGKPFLPTDLLKLMSEIEDASQWALPEETETFETEGFERESGDHAPEEADQLEALEGLEELEELEEPDFGSDEDAITFDETMFDDLEELGETLPEEEDGGSPVLDAEELEEVQHLLEEAEAPELSDEEYRTGGLNSNTLDEVNAVLEDLDLEESPEPADAEEAEAYALEGFPETADAFEETSGATAEEPDFGGFELEEEPAEPEMAEGVEPEAGLPETDAAGEATAEEEPDFGGFECEEAAVASEMTETAAAEAELSEESGTPAGVVPERDAGEEAAAEEEPAESAGPENVELSGSPEEASVAAAGAAEEEAAAEPELGDIEFEAAAEGGVDASLKALEAEIESAVSGLSDEELAEELDEATLLEIVNEADREEQRDAFSDELDRLDTNELKVALGEEAGETSAAAGAPESRAEPVTPREGLEALQTLVKVLENETIAKSLKGMNITINISFGAESE